MNLRTKVVLYFLLLGLLFFVLNGNSQRVDYLKELSLKEGIEKIAWLGLLIMALIWFWYVIDILKLKKVVIAFIITVVCVGAVIGYFENKETANYHNTNVQKQEDVTKNQENQNVKDLSSELVWYDTEKAIKHHLQPKYLNELDNYLIKCLKGPTLEDTIWNIVLWEDKVIKYDYEKARLEKEFYYETDEYGRVVSINANPKAKIQTPQQTINRKKGVCVDYAILTAAVLLGCGYQPVYIFVTETPNHVSDHVFTAVKINGEFYAIDQHPPIKNIYEHLMDLENEYGEIDNVGYYKIWTDGQKTYVEKHSFKNWSNGKKTLVFHLTNASIKSLNNSDGSKSLIIVGNEHPEASDEILSEIIKTYPYLHPDENLANMDSWEYLPRSYEIGITYTWKFPDVYIDRIFEKQYGKWFSQEILKDLVKRDISKYNSIWVKVFDDVDGTTVKIYLAEKRY